MLGSMLGVREGTHFIVDVFPSATGRFGALLNLFASLAVLVLALVFAWFGVEFTRFAWHRTSELADLPLWTDPRRVADDRPHLAGVPRRARRRAVAGPPREAGMKPALTAVDPGTAAWILFGLFFLLMFLRVPVAVALGLACLPLLLLEPNLSPMTLVQETFNSYNSFILLAVPFFLLTANLMNVGGITDRLVRLSRTMVGHMPGSLAQINVVLSISSRGSPARRPPTPRASRRSSSTRSARRATTTASRWRSPRCRRCSR